MKDMPGKLKPRVDKGIFEWTAFRFTGASALQLRVPEEREPCCQCA